MLLALIGLHVGVTYASAQSVPPSHAKVQLVAEGNAVTAGQTAWVGVLFELEPGWHIYWVNPGDAGDPPRMQWELPLGFRVGDVRWPVPVRLGTATLVDYGYEGRVLLAAPLQVPADYNAGAPLRLAADVRYVICREVCIPARARTSASLPYNDAPGALAGRRDLFRTTRQRWPKPMPRGWQVNATDSGAQFVLSMQTGSREAQAAFFPRDADQIDNAAAQAVTPTERGVQLTLRKSDPMMKPISTLRGLVVLAPDRAFEIAAPVSPRR